MRGAGAAAICMIDTMAMAVMLSFPSFAMMFVILA